MSHAILAEIKHLAVHDGPGIRTTVFLKGCSLHCAWCHNPECIAKEKQLQFRDNRCRNCGMCITVCPQRAHSIVNGIHRLDRKLCIHCGTCAEQCDYGALTLCGTEISIPDIYPELLEDRDFYRQSGGGVTLSGGEPLLYPEFCAELLKQLKSDGIHGAVDTAGNVDYQNFLAVIPYTAMFLYDLKGMDDTEHRRGTGASNSRIIENLKHLDSEGVPIEIRMPLVPSFNMDAKQICAAGELIAGLHHVRKVKLLAYHCFAENKYRMLNLPFPLPGIPAPEHDAIQELGKLLAARLSPCGIEVVFP